MKKITILLMLIAGTMGSFAQSDQEEIDLMQAVFGMEKKAIVASFVTPDATQQEAFWALYDEYEVKRKEYGKKRISLLKQYASQYNTMTAEQADAWTQEVIKLGSSVDKLVVTYYNKIKKATNPIVATQFYQIENFILASIRAEILGEIPFLK